MNRRDLGPSDRALLVTAGTVLVTLGLVVLLLAVIR